MAYFVSAQGVVNQHTTRLYGGIVAVELSASTSRSHTRYCLLQVYPIDDTAPAGVSMTKFDSEAPSKRRVYGGDDEDFAGGSPKVARSHASSNQSGRSPSQFHMVLAAGCKLVSQATAHTVLGSLQ